MVLKYLTFSTIPNFDPTSSKFSEEDRFIWVNDHIISPTLFEASSAARYIMITTHKTRPSFENLNLLPNDGIVVGIACK